ncbi:hypothetical protein [Erythrobacter donghaensis]|uniref:hypothetical protein n=1 Tax=Erythrobacter donghaensis TaxID=267135 RepID=UPI000A3BA788|nr:hypothetical protein [Erythrobacter donghaensis]
MRGIRPFGVALILAAPFAAVSANDGGGSPQDRANNILLCASAMQFSEDNGEPLRFSSDVLFEEFLTMEREEGISREVARKWATAEFDNVTAGLSEFDAEQLIFDTAMQCEFRAIEREEQRLAAQGGQSGAPGAEIDVAFLRQHFATNRNPRLIADYIVDRYPGGKGRMGPPIPEGEYLGELVVELGKSGVQALSDPAIVAMITDPFWQYNPPATRLVTEEYQRRLRVMRFNERDAQAWAGRVQAERRREMESTAVRSAERWGTGVKCTNVAPQGLEGKSYTSCRVLDRYGQ